MNIKVNCAVCGKEKEVTPTEFSRSKSGKFFCNNKHSLKWKSLEAKRRKAEKIKTAREEKKRLKEQARIMKRTSYCAVCNKTFIKPVNANNKLTCSPTCSAILHNEKRKHKRRTSEEFRKRESERKRIYLEKNREEINARERERYHADVAGRKTKRKMRNKAVRIGLLIKAETMNTPIYGSKSLWNGEGEWSKVSDKCLDCGTSIYKHHGNGVCISCYEKARWDALAPEEKKLKLLKRRQKYHEEKQTALQRKLEANKFIERAQRKEIEVTDKIRNLLDNLYDEEDYSVMIYREKNSQLNELELKLDTQEGLELDKDGFIRIKSK